MEKPGMIKKRTFLSCRELQSFEKGKDFTRQPRHKEEGIFLTSKQKIAQLRELFQSSKHG